MVTALQRVLNIEQYKNLCWQLGNALYGIHTAFSAIHLKVSRTKKAATMLFGISEEYIGLLLVLAVCLITVTIIAAHEGWFSTAPKKATPRNRRGVFPEVQTQPEQLQHTSLQPEGLRQRRGHQRVQGSAEFVRHRLLPYLPREDPELTVGVQTTGPSAQREPYLVRESAQVVVNVQEKARRQTMRTQCAAIILFLEDDEESFEFDPPYEEHPEKLFVPQNKDFVNYIISKPNKSRGAAGHAERIIIRNFTSLKEAFQKKYKQDPVKILLYSELMPCTACTDAIINTLSQLAQRVRVELHYAKPYQREQESIQSGSRDRLKQSRLSVHHTQN